MKTHIVKLDNDTEEYIVWIGESDVDNFKIIDQSKKDYIWFHVDKFPSAHVILVTEGHTTIPKQIFYECASICKQHSKQKNNSCVNVVYTSIDNIKKEVKPGSVSFRSNRKVTTIQP